MLFRSVGGWVPNREGGRENLDAVDFLREVTSVVRHEVPSAMVIAEESTAWPKVTHPVEYGGLGFTHKWNMGWMHDTLGYMQTDPVHRKWHHRDLSFGLLYAFTERFVLPLSHDEVVHGKGSLLSKMPGDDWQRFANLRALFAWMWAMPGAPLLFMGAEIAPFTEWSESSGLPWHLLDFAPHRGVRNLLTDLNRRAEEWPCVHERDHEPTGFQWLEADSADESIYAFLRWGHGGGSSVACVANFTPVPRHGYRVALPSGGTWREILNTDASLYGGSNLGNAGQVCAESIAATGLPFSTTLTLPPLAAVWLAPAPG